jgi:uncharacterized protein YjaG (DUF416 family)
VRSEQLKSQIDKLERLDHRTPVVPTFDAFDAETEALLGRLYGEAHHYLEAYKYASLGEAEALVNLPESAQEQLAEDRAKTAIQQRRQVLLGIFTEVQELEAREADMLLGEDREDPPGYS